MHWLGDQLASFDRNDGLGSVIPLYLSAGLSGIPLTHSDVGGYVRAIGHQRTFEVWARWLELEAFTPVMRTHHGSEPEAAIQWYSSPETLSLFRRYARWHQRLLPYFTMLVEQAAQTGAPACRPLWWGNENQTSLYQIETEMLVGPHLLLAPILEEGSTSRHVVFPPGNWARWHSFDTSLDSPISQTDDTFTAALDETILFVGPGAAIALLNEDYDTLAPVKDTQHQAGVRTAPETFTTLEFLLSPGGETTGSLQNESFGTTTWSWSAQNSEPLTFENAQWDGQALGPCEQADSTNCITDTQQLKLRYSSSDSGRLSLPGSDAQFIFESDTITDLMIRY